MENRKRNVHDRDEVEDESRQKQMIAELDSQFKKFTDRCVCVCVCVPTRAHARLRLSVASLSTEPCAFGAYWRSIQNCQSDTSTRSPTQSSFDGLGF